MARDNKHDIWSIDWASPTVEAELRSLPEDMQGRFLRIAELLTSWGPQRVGMPYTRPLGDKLWEIRLSGRSGIGRVIYTAMSGRRLVMLHAFVKKTEKTPSQAIAIAQKRVKDIDR